MNQTSSTARKEQRAVWRVAGALWRASVGRWAEREFAVLAALALAAAALWGFVELAGEVLEGETHAFDERILLALRSATDRSDPLGPGWLEELMRDVTGLGSTGVLTFITLAAAGFLALDRKTHAALFVVAAVGRRHAAQHAAQDGLRPAATRPRAARRARLYRELPERPRDTVGGGVPDARRAAGARAAALRAQALSARASRSCSRSRSA